MRTFLAAAVCAAMSPAFALADAAFLEFHGGIGVIPVSSAPGTGATAETVNRNVVRGVQPGGQPWVVAGLDARISSDGRLRLRGRGLLLAGGNNVGLNGNQRVFATLVCETSGFVERSTDAAGVPLDAAGDFEIDDTLGPWPPGDCASPVLLVRSAANRAWFAAGIPDHGASRDREDR